MNRVLQPNEDRDKVIASIRRFIFDLPTDKPYLIDITRLKKKRTNLQNRALWGVAYKVINMETGYKPEKVHNLMCGEFFGWKADAVFGNPTKEPVRTTTHDSDGKRDVIDREELGKFYLAIQAFCAPWGVDMPDPDPDWKINLELVSPNEETV